MKRKPMQGWLAAALLVTSLWSGTPAFAYSIGEEVKIDVSQPEISKAGFDISSDYAVWMVEGENTITLYDLDKNTETDIGDKNSTKTNPYVDGNYVVWIDSRDGGSDVYMYDIAKKKETRITDGSAEVSSLEIAGKNIVWADKREVGSDIYLYNISTGKTERISTSGKASKPVAADSYIVWEDKRSGSADIYYYDVKSKREKAAVTSKGDQLNPTIYQNQIVYENHSSEYIQLNLYSITNGKNKKLTDSSDDKEMPHLYKDKYVFVDDNDLGLGDVDSTGSKQIAGFIYDKLAPRVYGDYVLYAKADTAKKLRLHLYDYDEKESVPLGEVSGEPSQPDGSDRYVVYIAEGNKTNSVILYDAEENTSRVISKADADPTRPLVSNRYVVWYDESEDALFSYDIQSGEQKQVTDEDDDQTPDEKLYELDGNNLLWVNVDRRAELILTDLSSDDEKEIITLKKDPLSIDIYGNYLTWVVEQSSQKASIYLYDVEEDDDTEIRKNVQVKDAKLGESFVVWSEYSDKAKATWDLMYYDLDREKVNSLLRYNDRDQINPQASRNMVFYEDNRLSPNKKDYYHELFDVEDGSFSDIFWSDDAEVEQPRIGGNRLVWIDKRDDDAYVYTMAFAQPNDDEDDDEENE